MTDQEIKALKEQLCGPQSMMNACSLSSDRVIDCRFSIGDTVRLRSGGEIMTVGTYPDPSGIIDLWFFDKTTPVTIRLPQNCLKRIGAWGTFWNSW